jgi:hypothetical protein
MQGSNSGPPPGMPQFPLGMAPGGQPPFGYAAAPPPGMRMPPGMQAPQAGQNQQGMPFFMGPGGFARPGAVPTGAAPQGLPVSQPVVRCIVNFVE